MPKTSSNIGKYLSRVAIGIVVASVLLIVSISPSPGPLANAPGLRAENANICAYVGIGLPIRARGFPFRVNSYGSCLAGDVRLHAVALNFAVLVVATYGLYRFTRFGLHKIKG